MNLTEIDMRSSALFFAAIFSIFCAGYAIKCEAQDTRSYEYADADNKLNDIYRIINAHLNEADREGFKKAQRHWIAFRDLDCLWGWASKLECLTARTEERARQLRESTLFDKSGKQISLK